MSDLISRLRYMGKQYSAGQYARGGGVQKHYLEEAADALEAQAKRIAELEAQVKALKTHPCLLEDGQFDHDWKFVDDSFDHEFGTEFVHYFKCRHCEAHRDADEGDCTIDEGGH